MTTEEAFQAIIDFLSQRKGIRLNDHTYDGENFGNFVVSFINQEKKRSLVCDRGELVLCHDLVGVTDCVTVLPSVRDATKKELLMSLDSL